MTIRTVEILFYRMGFVICYFYQWNRLAYELNRLPIDLKQIAANTPKRAKIENSHHDINADRIKIVLGHPKFI